MEFLIFNNVFYDLNENYMPDQKKVSSKSVYLLDMKNFFPNFLFLSHVLFLGTKSFYF